MSKIIITQGDITQAKVDAIVNAANPQMLGGGGVDGAIHKAAGPELLEACKKAESIKGIRCPFGEARITVSGNLFSKYVIHTAGPIYRNEKDPRRVLESSYRNCLRLSIQYQCKSIAFPAISCGVYGYPAIEAADIAIAISREQEFLSMQIHHYLFGKEIFDTWMRAYQAVES